MEQRRKIASCPTCGRELDERDWQRCPFCGEPIPRGDEALPPAGMLTDFGLGMVAATVGGVLTAVAAMTVESGWPLQARMVLWPMAAGTAGALAASWLGRHLIRPMRRSFERLLIAAMLGLMPAATVGLALDNAWAGPAVLTGLTAIIYSHIRHKPPDWGYPPQRDQRN